MRELLFIAPPLDNSFWTVTIQIHWNDETGSIFGLHNFCFFFSWFQFVGPSQGTVLCCFARPESGNSV